MIDIPFLGRTLHLKKSDGHFFRGFLAAFFFFAAGLPFFAFFAAGLPFFAGVPCGGFA
jgi:hypothetical protein